MVYILCFPEVLSNRALYHVNPNVESSCGLVWRHDSYQSLLVLKAGEISTLSIFINAVMQLLGWAGGEAAGGLRSCGI